MKGQKWACACSWDVVVGEKGFGSAERLPAQFLIRAWGVRMGPCHLLTYRAASHGAFRVLWSQSAAEKQEVSSWNSTKLSKRKDKHGRTGVDVDIMSNQSQRGPREMTSSLFHCLVVRCWSKYSAEMLNEHVCSLYHTQWLNGTMAMSRIRASTHSTPAVDFIKVVVGLHDWLFVSGHAAWSWRERYVTHFSFLISF